MSLTKTERPKLNIVCFSVYPVEGPSLRHRIWNYRPYWKQGRIELTVWPFMTSYFYKIRRRFGYKWTAIKLVLFVYCTLRLLLRIPRSAFYDKVIIHREVFPVGGAIMEKLVHLFNRRIIYDLDDAIWHPPSNGINQRNLFWSDTRLSDVLKISQVAVVGNEYIESYAGRFCNHIVQIPTPYDDLGDTGLPQDTNEPPRILWIGNLGNTGYVRRILPVFERLAGKYPFTLCLVGGDDIFGVTSPSVQIEHLLWSEVNERDSLLNSHIGIMPLEDSDYEKGKCAFKLIQYYSAGLPVVASAVGMNCQVVQDGETGFLVTTESEWETALMKLITDADMRNRMRGAGRLKFKKTFTREYNAKKWENIFYEV